MRAYSVVIPTHDRLDTLPEVLAAVESQRQAPEFEVVIVDDGSRDGTAEFLDRLELEIPATVLRQENRGPAAARNRGVEEATGERVAFLGDDTVPEAGWLAAHERGHERRRGRGPLAVLGYTSWHPRLETNPFLEYINEQGPQFGYALIDDPESVPFNFFYTSNVSLSRDLLLAEPFDLGFPYPAWEDIELAYRLRQRHGLELVYEPDARVSHDHPTDLARFCARQEKAGYSAVVFYRRHPELGGFLGLGPEGPPPLPSALVQSFRELLVRLLQPVLQRFDVSTPRLWEKTLRYHYLRGLHRGWRQLGLEPPGRADVPAGARGRARGGDSR